MKNCIYKLYFIDEPNKVYIGSATNFEYRLKAHVKELIDRKHTNKLLQITFNKKGLFRFRWEILEKNLKPSELLEVENDYIVKYDSINKGFNQTVVTTATKGDRLFIPNDYGEYDYTLIEDFLKIYDVELKLVTTGIYKQTVLREGLKKINCNYTKNFWDKIDDTTISKYTINLYTYMRCIPTSQRHIICCCDSERVSTYLSTNRFSKKSYMDMYNRLKRFYEPNLKYKITDVLVISSFNHFFLEKLPEEEAKKYKVMKLFKLLALTENLASKITLHLPNYLYEIYTEVINEVKNKK